LSITSLCRRRQGCSANLNGRAVTRGAQERWGSWAIAAAIELEMRIVNSTSIVKIPFAPDGVKKNRAALRKDNYQCVNCEMCVDSLLNR